MSATVDTPDGYNIKRYGVMDGKYGIYRLRIPLREYIVHFRSLFYEETEEAVENIKMYATNFGNSGTYYDCNCDIAKKCVDFSKLINLDITDEEINEILVTSGFKGYLKTEIRS